MHALRHAFSPGLLRFAGLMVLLATRPLFGDTVVAVDPTDIALIGTDQSIGCVVFTVANDEVTQVTPDPPMFDRITPDQGSGPGAALVAQPIGSSSGYRTKPVVLPKTQVSEEPNRPLGKALTKTDHTPAVIPHLTRFDSDFATDIQIANHTDTVQEVTLTAYEKTGKVVSTVTLSPAPGENLIRNRETLFQSVTVSHLTVTGDVDVAAIYRANTQTGSPAHVWAVAEPARQWRLQLGDNALTFDGLALVNRGEEAAVITAVLHDEEGTEVRLLHLHGDLAPNAKTLVNLSALLGADKGSTLTVQATQPLAITALRGNHDATYLWENKALPINPE